MENPQCVLLNFVKVEDSEYEVKQEAADVEDEAETYEDDDPLGADDDTGDLGDSLFASNYVETIHSKQPLSGGGGRRRLRFSDSDDRLLLAEVARQDPYRTPAAWRDITATVARHAGKAFTARAVREHTDHLMNCFALKGEDACLRRTPVEHWAQKKKLLHQVYLMWKGNGRMATMTNTVTSSKEGDEEEEAVTEASALVSKTRASTPKTSVTNAASAAQPPRSVFLPRPLTLHLNGSSLRMACPPLHLPSSTSHKALQGLQLQGLQGLQGVTVAATSGFSPAVLGKSLLIQSTPSPNATSKTTSTVAATILSRKAAEQTGETTEPANKSTEGSATTAAATVDRGCSPIQFVDVKEETQALQSTLIEDDQKPSPSDVSGSRSAETQTSEHYHSGRNKRLRKTTLTRARLELELRRHRDRVALRRLQLALEARRVSLEERRWAQERSERRERLRASREERAHRAAMERRQQAMVDALLTLRSENMKRSGTETFQECH